MSRIVTTAHRVVVTDRLAYRRQMPRNWVTSSAKLRKAPRWYGRTPDLFPLFNLRFLNEKSGRNWYEQRSRL